MVAAVETMMYAGDTPWHGFGTYGGDNPILSDDVLRLSGLDWSVEGVPLVTENGNPVSTHKAIVRSSDSKILGVVGKKYQALQNEEALSMMDSLVQEGDMRYHTAGSLRGGTKVWLLGKVNSFEVVPDDKVDQFLLLYNSHDGTGALRIFFTNVRVVCTNTAQAALRAGRGTGVSIRHTKNMMNRVEKAREVLGMSVQAHKEYADFSKYLVGKQMSKSKMEDFVEKLIPLNEGAKFATKAQNQRDNIIQLFESGVGQDIPGVGGTAWAAYNAVTEYANYFRTTRGGQERRFESALFGSGAGLVEQASSLLIAA